LLNVWTGKLGGPVADLAQLVGEVLEVRRAPVTFEVDDVGAGGKGYFAIGDLVEAEMAGRPVRRCRCMTQRSRPFRVRLHIPARRPFTR
jgi:hypothetical protein